MKHEITLKLKINAWVICAVLLFTNLLLIGLWHPWTNSSVNTRQITITGSATIEAEPDQYVFNPYFQKVGTDKSKLNSDLSELSKTILAKLKELGVDDSAIKTNSSTYDYGIYNGDKSRDEITATLYLTITLKDKKLAQSIQDYLATTDYTGTITPYISFSTTKRIELEKTARTKALADAKTKAESSVKELNSRLGKVARVSDLSSPNFMPLMYADGKNAQVDSVEGSTSSYNLQPGLDEYSFSIEVTYDLN